MVSDIEIYNKVQEEMSKKFGWFIMMFLFWLPKYNNWYKTRIEEEMAKRRNLTKEEAEFLADFFHNEQDPDYDGFIGQYVLPEEVMKIYRKKYSKERGWEE